MSHHYQAKTKKRDFLESRFLRPSETKQLKSFESHSAVNTDYAVAANPCHAAADLFAAADDPDDHFAFFAQTEPAAADSAVHTVAFDSVDLPKTDQHSLRMPSSAWLMP